MGGCIEVKKRGRNQPLYMIGAELLKGAKGEIGMTKCPTYKDIKDFATEGFDVLVTLLEEKELEELSVPNLREIVIQAGLESLWLPIGDQDIPKDILAFDRLINAIVSKVKEGKKVIIHCKKGKGRTGTIATCCLIKLGYCWDDALHTVRTIRNNKSMQHRSQMKFIKDYYLKLIAIES